MHSFAPFLIFIVLFALMATIGGNPKKKDDE